MLDDYVDGVNNCGSSIYIHIYNFRLMLQVIVIIKMQLLEYNHHFAANCFEYIEVDTFIHYLLNIFQISHVDCEHTHRNYYNTNTMLYNSFEPLFVQFGI